MVQPGEVVNASSPNTPNLQVRRTQPTFRSHFSIHIVRCCHLSTSNTPSRTLNWVVSISPQNPTPQNFQEHPIYPTIRRRSGVPPSNTLKRVVSPSPRERAQVRDAGGVGLPGRRGLGRALELRRGGAQRWGGREGEPSTECRLGAECRISSNVSRSFGRD